MGEKIEDKGSLLKQGFQYRRSSDTFFFERKTSFANKDPL